MAVVFLLGTDGSTMIAMDATTDISYSRNASMTKNTVQSGATITDHYHPQFPKVTFSGLVTDSKIRGETPTVSNFRRLVEEVMDSAQPFTLYGTDDGAIPDIDRCLITNFNAERGVRNFNSMQVSISVEKIDISESAKADKIVQPSKKTNGQLSDKTNNGVGSKTEVKEGIQYTQLAKRGGVV